MSEFRRLVRQHAWKETVEALKLTREQIAITLLKYLAVVAIGFVYFSMTAGDLWKAFQSSIVLTLAIPIVLLLPFFLYKRWTLPSKMWDEAQEKITELSQGRPNLRLVYEVGAADRGNHKMTFLNAISEGTDDVMDVRVLINEVRFKAAGSETWALTSIRTRHIMSWTNVPDDPNRRAEKYGARQLSQGDNTVDFITSPAINTQGRIYLDALGRRAFLFRIDPAHAQVVNNAFADHGTYKFVMQVSAPNILNPPRLTLLVEWDGQFAIIKSKDERVLETI
jgi:hypothetical protein